MVPESLGGWSLASIRQLVAAGVFESRRFDFKEMLPRDDAGKVRLRKTFAAFANAEGGFLVVGVKDDKGLAASDRIVGVDSTLDFPELLGAQASQCTPAVQWTLRNPPDHLDGGRVVHVVEIHEAKTKPHGLFDGERWIFPKRTERGNEAMSYEEIRGAFRDQHLVMASLKVLQKESTRIAELAWNLNIELHHRNSAYYIYQRFRPAMFEAAWVQVLGRLTLEESLTRAVDELLGAAHAADEERDRVLGGTSDGADFVLLVQQVNTQAKLASMSLARLVS